MKAVYHVHLHYICRIVSRGVHRILYRRGDYRVETVTIFLGDPVGNHVKAVHHVHLHYTGLLAGACTGFYTGGGGDYRDKAISVFSRGPRRQPCEGCEPCPPTLYRIVSRGLQRI